MPGRVRPKLHVKPHFCVVVDGARWLALGVFPTRRQAQDQIDRKWRPPWFATCHVEIEPIWISARDVHTRVQRASSQPARSGREEANAG